MWLNFLLSDLPVCSSEILSFDRVGNRDFFEAPCLSVGADVRVDIHATVSLTLPSLPGSCSVKFALLEPITRYI